MWPCNTDVTYSYNNVICRFCIYRTPFNGRCLDTRALIRAPTRVIPVPRCCLNTIDFLKHIRSNAEIGHIFRICRQIFCGLPTVKRYEPSSIVCVGPNRRLIQIQWEISILEPQSWIHILNDLELQSTTGFARAKHQPQKLDCFKSP